SENEPLYLPSVWHSAQRALIIGTMSCAKSTGLRPGPSPLATDAAHPTRPRHAQATARRRAAPVRRLRRLCSIPIASLREWCECGGSGLPPRRAAPRRGGLQPAVGVG